MMRRGKLLAYGAAGVVLVAAAIYGVVAFRAWYAERHARQAYAATQRCLFGNGADDPLRALRGAELSISLRQEPSSWPGRCAGYIEHARRGVGQLLGRRWGRCGPNQCCADDQRCSQLERLSFQLAAAAGYAQLGKSSLLDPEELTALAHALSLDGAAAPVHTDPPPAPPPSLLDPRRMTPLYQGDYLRLLTDPGGTRGIDLLFYDHERRYGMCRTPLSEDGPASCGVLPGSIPVGMAGELLAAAPSAPLTLFAQGPRDDSWTEALFDVDSGDKIIDLPGRPLGGFVWARGNYARLSDNPPLAGATLFRVMDGQADAHAAVEARDVLAGPTMLYDQVVWAEAGGDGWYNIKVQPVQRYGEPLGAPATIGGIESPTNRFGFDLCRTDKALALLTAYARGEQVAGMLSFRTAPGGWRAPQSVLLGARRFGFTCRDDTATFSWIVALRETPEDGWVGALIDGVDAPLRGSYKVHRLRCAPRGCEHRTAVLSLRRYSKNSRYVAGDVGDAMLVLWRSPLGDVRMRLAPLEDLAAAPDVPLFDDVEHDGFGWDLERDPIFGRADKVLMLLSRQLGEGEESATYGVVIDAQGKVNAMQVNGAGSQL